jgi:hypothetical protein
MIDTVFQNQVDDLISGAVGFIGELIQPGEQVFRNAD